MIDPNLWANGRPLLSRMLLASLPLSLVVDSTNGLMMSIGAAVPISAIFKLMLLGLFIGHLIFTNRPRSLVALGAISLVLLLTISHLIRGGSADGALADLQWGLRSVLIVVAYFAFDEMLRSGDISPWHVTKAFGACTAVIVANLTLGMMGFGFAQYDETFGTAGFFFAGNELAVCIITLAATLFAIVFKSKGVQAYLALVAVFMAAAAVTLTKAAILGVMLLALLIPAAQVVATGVLVGRLQRKGMVFGAIAGILVILGVGVTAWFVVWSGFLERAKFFFAQAGWMGILLSGRELMIESAWSRFIAGADILDLMLGVGVGWLQERQGGQTESDLVDYAIAFGFPSVLILLGAMSAVVIAAAHALRAFGRFCPYASAVVVLAVALVGISVLAGHVFNSGTAAPLIGMSLAMWRCQVITTTGGTPIRYAN